MWKVWQNCLTSSTGQHIFTHSNNVDNVVLYSIFEDNYKTSYYKNGLLHRDQNEGPAVVHKWIEDSYRDRYYENGQLVIMPQKFKDHQKIRCKYGIAQIESYYGNLWYCVYVGNASNIIHESEMYIPEMPEYMKNV